MKRSRYEQAGVSIDAQERAIGNIKDHVKSTETERVLSGTGSFGGLFDISFPRMKRPVLVSSCDGVGTKLRIAFDADRHDTVGQCLVNHCINDILVQGAKPLFFMDYLATGKLKPHVVERILAGMAKACRENRLAILGGEMAEMPGFYRSGEYDVAGFITGVVDGARLLGAARVRTGQKLIGLPSSGLHTNGYSLARRIIFEEKGHKLDDRLPGMDVTVEDALLAIHRSYFPPLEGLLEAGGVQAMAHITGGGFMDNLPRILPADLAVDIHLGSWPMPPLFRFLVEEGGVERGEAYRVFNMGIGMILLVEPGDHDEVLQRLRSIGEAAYSMGEVVAGAREVCLRD